MAIDGINGISNTSPFDTLNKTSQSEDIDNVSFSQYLTDALNKTNDLQLESARLGNDLASGKTDNIHQVMIASEKADIALQFTMQIRNKIMDAYSEIMRISI